MAANKKRKLGESGGNSTPTMMSAFAARQQLWGAAASRKRVLVEEATPELSPSEDELQSGSRSGTPSTRPGSDRTSRGQSAEEAVQGSVHGEQAQSVAAEISGTSRPESQRISSVRQYSSLRPNKKNFQRKAGGRIVLTTPDPERLVLLGSYGVKVWEGEVTVAGALLTAADGVQWLHAPHCHAVPVLRTADDTILELQPHPTAKGLRQLAKLNPAFAKIWNETHSQDPGADRAWKPPRTFQIICTSEDVPKRGTLQELVLPAEWNKKLSGLAAAKRKGTPVVLLCGPKSSGKSTFGRVLANRLMTDRGGVKSKPWSGVMVLDLDPGQPEYSPPGVISLCKITAPNLSPPFCHPTLAPRQGQQLRAHAIASVTPALDPAYFIECVLDLFNHYRRSPDAKPPLVVNTPGWIQGTGLDILTELITAIRPTEVVYMSQDGPEETVTTLQTACTTVSPPTPFSTLPSQPSDISSRTSLHFRTMQTMSYFHLRPPSEPQQHATWDPAPLTELRPWRVRYSGPPSKRGFLGVLCYDHQPAPELLAEAINGTVLALVKAESRAAFRDLLLPSSLEEEESTNARPGPEDPPSEEEAEEEGRIPLIPNPQGRTLDPRHSRLLGLVLVRGVDTQRKELQLLTPLSREIIAGLAGEETVLVAGRFDAPSWAYSEELYRRAHVRAPGEADFDPDSDPDSDADSDGAGPGSSDSEGLEEEGPQEGMVVNNTGDRTVGALGRGQMKEIPWVEMLHGSQKRAVGSKVWRVRRDLGRN